MSPVEKKALYYGVNALLHTTMKGAEPMKILSLHIDGFGKLHDQDISFQDGMNVVYGKNEAGKSTLHTFIKGMLFGLERQRGRAARK
mgnify:CR=1 FL=1